MPRRKNPVQEPRKALDTPSKKRGRGRPPRVRPAEVFGRARNYRWILEQVWPKLHSPLLAAENTEDVIKAFEDWAQPYAQQFVPGLASDILAVIHERKFPKRAITQSGFLADSLAGRSDIKPRTSRDICVKERAKERAQSPHKILRKEFYIVCSCKYKGPARNDACPTCGAKIPETLWDSRLF